MSSFGAIEKLQRILSQATGLRFRDLPKMGHGGTLDPFATGVLPVLVGRGVKLARYFLGSTKGYEATLRFGQFTDAGDPTTPVTQTSAIIPTHLNTLRTAALEFQNREYWQTPPMHSAKKLNGRPLYELAREGKVVEREPKLCRLYRFEINSYSPPLAHIEVTCSSGTYIRTLAQDFAASLGSVGMLDRLHRTFTGAFHIDQAISLGEITSEIEKGISLNQLKGWIPFDQVLAGFPEIEVNETEALYLRQGKQEVIPTIVERFQRSAPKSVLPGHEDCLVMKTETSKKLVAVARKGTHGDFELERVFSSSTEN
jgi:tRNA pseudouridine55 synthase